MLLTDSLDTCNDTLLFSISSIMSSVSVKDDGIILPHMFSTTLLIPQAVPQPIARRDMSNTITSSPFVVSFTESPSHSNYFFYSTVTDLARFFGLSGSIPFSILI